MRIRTITKCCEEIKGIDPGTAINPWNIRRLIEDGKIRSWKSGTRHFIDVEEVMAFYGMRQRPQLTVEAEVK